MNCLYPIDRICMRNKFIRTFFCVLLLVFSTLIFAKGSAASNYTLVLGQTTVSVYINGKTTKLSDDELLRWVKNSALAVENYYRQFPVDRLRVDINVSSGKGVRSGKAFGSPRPLIRVGIGRDSTLFQLEKDWVMTHEMVHLAFPGLPEKQGWLLEGMATYIEPIARYSIGQYPEKQIWIDLIKNLPKGLPRSGDRGLDNTHTWGRTYWGGALFCFLADTRIRIETNNGKGLRDALVAINKQGGDITKSWRITDALSIGDKATGTSVLLDLYNEMKGQPVSVDLESYWQRYGVVYERGNVKFITTAPLANISKLIFELNK